MNPAVSHFQSMIRTGLCLLGFAIAVCGAAAAETAFTTQARNAILVDANTGIIYFEKDADASIEPASMSKLMTMTMVFEALKAGTLTPDQEITISENAWRSGGAASGGSTMYAVLKSRVPVRDLIRGVIIQSANDAAIVLAETLAGSEQQFAAQMTARAKQMGLKQSTFTNATGLPAEGHRMSVRDLAILANYMAHTFPEGFATYAETEFTWNKISQRNRNPLLGTYDGADGMKTGYTETAGFGLVGTAVRDGRRLIMVVAGLPTAKARDTEARALLDWGFSRFKPVDLFKAGEKIETVRVWGGTISQVDLVAGAPVHMSLSARERAALTIIFTYKAPLLAPVAAAAQIGTISISRGKQPIMTIPVLTANAVPASDSLWQRALDTVFMWSLGR